MAEDHTSPDGSPLAKQNVPATMNNGTGGDNADTQTGASPNTIRTVSSKVSNLRAAFEQAGKNDLPRSRSNDRRLVSSGRSSGVEAELSRLRDVLAKEQEQRDASKQRMEAMQSELEELRQQLQAHEDAKVESGGEPDPAGTNGLNGFSIMEDVAQYTEHPTDPEDDMDQSGHRDVTELSAAKAHYDNELGQLQAQLADMKRSIATNTRIETHELTDTSIVEEFRLINYHVQDWVVNTFRRTKVTHTVDDMLTAIESVDELYRDDLRALFAGYDSAWKVAFLQSAICYFMLPIFKHNMPFGLPTSQGWSKAVKLASQELELVLEPTAYNRWRATTCDVVCHSEVIFACVVKASNELAATMCSILDSICGTAIPEAQINTLELVVRKMIVLSHSLCTQRLAYGVHQPAPGSPYYSAGMESSLDTQDLPEDCTIQCTEFPAVFKTLATGERIIILKARVSLKDAFD